MSQGLQIVVCGGPVPDPLQTLEPQMGATGPQLRNEMMLPVVLDPWAWHALNEAASLAKRLPGSEVWLVSLGPRAKLQQLMMSLAQKVPFRLVALDGPAGGFTDPFDVAEALAGAIRGIEGLDRSRLLLFGGCSSASRDAGVTLPLIGERMEIPDVFLAVDELVVGEEGSLRVLERIEGGRHQVSVCQGPPAVLAWSTGTLPDPPNSPQMGMQNMRTILPALQRAVPSALAADGITFRTVEVPTSSRKTRVVEDASTDAIAREIVSWIEA
ncbi:MAG: electron transfer flavoprotein subunit beta [Acidobacteriota bacterium]|jgi:electron transfer flavoprotein beta subunit